MLITGQNSAAFITDLTASPYLARTESQSNTSLASCFLCFWMLGISTWKEEQIIQIHLGILDEFFKEENLFTMDFFFYFFKGTNFPNFPKEFYIKAAADLNSRPTITIYCLILVRLGSTRTHLCYAVERVHYLLLNKDFVLGELKSQLVLSIATGLQHLPLETRHQTTMHSLNRYQVIPLHSAL